MSASPPATAWLAADWPAPAQIRAGTWLRQRSGYPAAEAGYAGCNLAAHVGDDPARVARHRADVRAALNLAQEPAWLEQVHGSRVVDLDAAWTGPADGSCAASTGPVAAVLTADCLPVLLCDRAGQWIAALHAGWRGLADGVLEAGVAAYPGRPADLLAWLGPAIGPAAFEVDEAVVQAFTQRDPAAANAFRGSRPGHWCGDLYQLGRQGLAAVGVSAVYGGGLCSVGDPERYYSFRRDVTTGRMASLIWRIA